MWMKTGGREVYKGRSLGVKQTVAGPPSSAKRSRANRQTRRSLSPLHSALLVVLPPSLPPPLLLRAEKRGSLFTLNQIFPVRRLRLGCALGCGGGSSSNVRMRHTWVVVVSRAMEMAMKMRQAR